MNRKQRRANAVKWQQVRNSGKIAGIEQMGMSPLTDEQLEIVKERGLQARALYLRLVWSLRASWDQALASSSVPSRKPRLYSIGGTVETPSWRFAEFTNPFDMMNAKRVARESGTVAFVFGSESEAPDGEPGYQITVEHSAYVGLLERHHWSEKHGWRLYDCRVERDDAGGPPKLVSTLREGSADESDSGADEPLVDDAAVMKPLEGM